MAEQTGRKRKPRPPDGTPVPPLPPGRSHRYPSTRKSSAPLPPRDVTSYRHFHVRTAVMAALLVGKTLGQTAEVAGVSTHIVKQCLADPEFRADLEEARSDLLRAVLDRAASEAMKSVEALAAIRDSDQATSSSRVRASVELLRLTTGAPSIEINQTTVVGSHGGPDPAEQLRAFLGKLRDRDDALEQARRSAAIDVESTEQ